MSNVTTVILITTTERDAELAEIAINANWPDSREKLIRVDDLAGGFFKAGDGIWACVYNQFDEAKFLGLVKATRWADDVTVVIGHEDEPYKTVTFESPRPGRTMPSPFVDAAEQLAAAMHAEIRESGIFCPACETSLGDLPDDHRMTWRLDELPMLLVECNYEADSARVLETPAHHRDAMIIHVYENATTQALIGPQAVVASPATETPMSVHSVDQLRQTWLAELDLHTSIAVSLLRKFGPGSVAYQREDALISLLREHLAALDYMAAAGPHRHPTRAQFVGGPYDDLVLNFPSGPPCRAVIEPGTARCGNCGAPRTATVTR